MGLGCVGWFKTGAHEGSPPVFTGAVSTREGIGAVWGVGVLLLRLGIRRGVCGGGYAGAEVGDEGVDYWGVDDGNADLNQVLGIHEVPEGAGGDSSRERDGYEEHGVYGLRDGAGGDVAQP